MLLLVSQVMHNRDDHVATVFYPDGTTVVEHADGTRITCVRKQSQVVELESQEDGTGTWLFLNIQVVIFSNSSYICVIFDIQVVIFNNARCINDMFGKLSSTVH